MQAVTEPLIRCRDCAEEKSLDSFHHHPRGKYGRVNRCKPCEREYNRARYAEKRDQIRGQMRQWRYGLTPERHQALLAEQDGVCALCKRVCAYGKALAVDHDHSCCPGDRSCGECVRGLLCGRCNGRLLPAYEALPVELQTWAFLNDYLSKIH